MVGDVRLRQPGPGDEGTDRELPFFEQKPEYPQPACVPESPKVLGDEVGTARGFGEPKGRELIHQRPTISVDDDVSKVNLGHSFADLSRQFPSAIPTGEPVSASTVTRKTFDREVLASDQPVIVDFWAPWCGPCLAVGPVLDKIAAERPGQLRVAKVNVDEEPELAARFGVQSIPTIVLFKNGEPVAGTVEARGKSQLEKALGLSRPAVTDDDRERGGLRGLIARLAGRSS